MVSPAEAYTAIFVFGTLAVILLSFFVIGGSNTKTTTTTTNSKGTGPKIRMNTYEFPSAKKPGEKVLIKLQIDPGSDKLTTAKLNYSSPSKSLDRDIAKNKNPQSFVFPIEKGPHRYEIVLEDSQSKNDMASENFQVPDSNGPGGSNNLDLIINWSPSPVTDDYDTDDLDIRLDCMDSNGDLEKLKFDINGINEQERSLSGRKERLDINASKILGVDSFDKGDTYKLSAKLYDTSGGKIERKKAFTVQSGSNKNGGGNNPNMPPQAQDFKYMEEVESRLKDIRKDASKMEAEVTAAYNAFDAFKKAFDDAVKHENHLENVRDAKSNSEGRNPNELKNGYGQDMSAITSDIETMHKAFDEFEDHLQKILELEDHEAHQVAGLKNLDNQAGEAMAHVDRMANKLKEAYGKDIRK